MKKQIHFTKGYKYRLEVNYTAIIPIFGYEFENDIIKLTIDGTLTIKRGFNWDGASFIVIDTKSVLRASLVHDALYWLLRHEILPQEEKSTADRVYYIICVEDGVWQWRAKYMYKGLLIGGASAASPKNKKEVFIV